MRMTDYEIHLQLRKRDRKTGLSEEVISEDNEPDVATWSGFELEDYGWYMLDRLHQIAQKLEPLIREELWDDKQYTTAHISKNDLPVTQLTLDQIDALDDDDMNDIADQMERRYSKNGYDQDLHDSIQAVLGNRLSLDGELTTAG